MKKFLIMVIAVLIVVIVGQYVSLHRANYVIRGCHETIAEQQEVLYDLGVVAY